MDLTNFTQNKKESKVDTKEYLFKDAKELFKHEDELFFSPSKAILFESIEKADEFFRQSLKDGVEGVMTKNLEAQYKPGIRTGAMTKVKETKEDLDLVILAAEYGKGKRAGFYSSFLVGILDSETGEFYEVGKVSSGIKELGDEGASLTKITSLLKPLKIKEEGGLVYFEPKIVIQVRYQEIQKSTTYKSGYALRFPRIIFLREDKTPEEINTIDDLDMFA